MKEALLLLSGMPGRKTLEWMAVLLAGGLLALTVWGAVTGWMAVRAEKRVVHHAPLQPAGTRPSVAGEQVAGRHLFGNALASDAAGLPGTRLQLELTGIMNAADAGPSFAIVSSGEGAEGHVYRTGDVLPGTSVRIYAIHQDAVVIENGGRLERLSLNRESLPASRLPKHLLGGDT